MFGKSSDSKLTSKTSKKQLFTELKQAATIPRQSSGHPQRNTATTALLLS